MKIRADIAELLHEGLSNRQIANRLGVYHATVARARTALRLPPSTGGTRRATPEAVFHANTTPVRGGHLDWTGHRGPNGTPLIRIAGTCTSATRFAFQLQYGREPVGNVKPGCDHDGCIAPAHVEDRPMRTRNRNAYEAIFGGQS